MSNWSEGHIGDGYHDNEWGYSLKDPKKGSSSFTFGFAIKKDGDVIFRDCCCGRFETTHTLGNAIKSLKEAIEILEGKVEIEEPEEKEEIDHDEIK